MNQKLLPASTGPEIWYRYWGSFMTEYEVLRHTPCGVWIKVSYYDFWPARPQTGEVYQKFILKNARKHWANSTKDAAIEDWKERKKKQIKVLKEKIRGIEESLLYAPKDAAHLERMWNIGWQIDLIKIQ